MSNRKGMYDLPPKRQESDLDEDVFLVSNSQAYFLCTFLEDQ